MTTESKATETIANNANGGDTPGAWTLTAYILDRSPALRILAALSNLGILLVVVGFWFDLNDRYDARTVQSWQLLTTKAPGNSGKREALEYLNKTVRIFWISFKEKQDLVGIDLSTDDRRPQVYLEGVQLPEAILVGANLSSAFLFEANLNRAKLINTTLEHTDFRSANLRGADMESAFLQDANFTEADMTNAYLEGVTLHDTNFVKANLSGATITMRDNSPNWFGLTNISNATIGWPGYPQPLAFGPTNHKVVFWAWSDRLPKLGGTAVQQEGNVKWLDPETPSTVEGVRERLGNFAICSTEHRKAWNAKKETGMPEGCDPHNDGTTRG